MAPCRLFYRGCAENRQAPEKKLRIKRVKNDLSEDTEKRPFTQRLGYFSAPPVSSLMKLEDAREMDRAV